MVEPVQTWAEKTSESTSRKILKRLVDARPEHVVVSLGLIFGLLSAGITPPMQAPDETEHFYRAYQISEGTLIPLKIGEPKPGGSTGGYLPEALEVVESFNPLRHHPDRKIVAMVATLRRLMATTIESDQRRFFVFSNTAAYSPIPYLPQAAGIAFGRLFTGSPIVLSYLARTANLLAWLAMVALAIRTIPILKWSLVAVALTPMSLFLAASASADAVTNACSWWFIAQTLRLLAPASLVETQRTKINLLLSAVVLSLVKVPYQILVFLPAGLVVSRLIPRYDWRIIALMFVVMAGGFLTWTANAWSTFSPYDPHWDPPAQLRFLIANPAALCRGTFGYLLPAYFCRTAVQLVGKLGWLDTDFPSFVYPIHLATLLLVATTEPVVLPPSTRRRLAVVSISVGLVACWLVCFVVLVAGTAVGAEQMFVQGRYFLPVAPVLMVAIACMACWRDYLKGWQNMAAIAWALYLPSVLTLMIMVLRSRFYL
jgi:uncharacterized membrane protein